MDKLEHLVPPPLVALALAGLMWWLATWPPSWPWSGQGRMPVVGALVVLGLVFDLSGLASFVRRRTTVNPLRPERASSLVTGGIYRITRNPMYVGLACLLLAWALFLWSPWALLGPVLFMAWITRFQIVPEERALEQLFGDAYRDYCARVRRWL
ncbi:MAG: isoprenylcysteine carboxylmethyltransferase family protein [Burkholderiales bacterium]|nr:MAG: isoprenylcysteine carboxylmethyltransferase family protein [Burkholderiales bacterium]